MSEANDAVEDTVDGRAAGAFSSLKNVTDASVNSRLTVAGGVLCTIRYVKSENVNWGWYFEKEDIRRVLYRTEEVATLIADQSKPKTLLTLIGETPFLDLAKFFVVSLLALSLLATVIFITIQNTENKSLQVLTGTLTLLIGYLIGKGDTAKQKSE